MNVGVIEKTYNLKTLLPQNLQGVKGTRTTTDM